MTILVTGAAGFIGYHVAKALLARGERVVGIDNFDPYYSVALKRDRIAELARHNAFSLEDMDISVPEAAEALVSRYGDATATIHLAAQPGVRAAELNPYSYIAANLAGQLTVLEVARRLKGLRHTVYASTSAVYGASPHRPFSLDDRADQPISLYGATKRGAEMIASSYAAQYGLASTGLRFFTVYGPWGRPDMATWKFTDAIVHGTALTLYDDGNMTRSFTYIDDIVAGVLAALDHAPPTGAHKLYNLGNDKSESVRRYLAVLEQAIGKKALISVEPRHKADMVDTVADISATERELSWRPRVGIDQGLPRFVEWYRGYTSGK
jgi:UDP-glucuronate 4-epimerase